MARTARTSALTGLAATGLVVGTMVALPGTAGAVACTGQVSYAQSTNTLKLNSGTLDLPELLVACAAAPLLATDPASHTWLLKANLVVQNGATLLVRGTGTGVPAADEVDALHLLSRSSNSPLEVVNLSANYGTLTFDSTRVTSWDDQALPAGGDVDRTYDITATPGGVGRAFVRAISTFDPVTKVPLESRMDITNSEFAFLGYYASEAYGVAYKGRTCDKDHLAACAALNVYGSERNSHFHDNYMGTYTFDAEGMVFDHDEYDHNVMYGLDPHDDSDHLTITNNHAHDNGDHGIICSQRCDHLTITGNEVDHNGYPPFVPPGDDNVGDNQVHGIMIHRGVTDSLIADNVVHDNNGAGIAVFDSFDNTIRDNTLTGNLFGLRTSVGSHDNLYTGNVVRASKSYAVNAYPGANAPYYGIVPSGRPTSEHFVGNTFDGTGGNLVALLSTDDFQFVDNTVTGVVGKVAADSSTGVVWRSTSAPGLGVYLRNANRSSDATVALPLTPFKVSPGPSGTVSVQAAGGVLVDVSGKAPFATVTTIGSTTTAVYTLDTATIGPATSSTVTPRPVSVVPDSGTIQARMAGWTSLTTRHVYLRDAGIGTRVAISWGGLAPNQAYFVRDNGTGKTAHMSDGAGTLAWTFVEPSGAPHDLTIKSS